MTTSTPSQIPEEFKKILPPEGFEIPWDRAPRPDEIGHIYMTFGGDFQRQKEYESHQADLAFEAISSVNEPTDDWHGDFWIRFATHKRDLAWFAYVVLQHHFDVEEIITEENMIDLVESAWTICEYPESNLDGGLEAWRLIFDSVGYVSEPSDLKRPGKPIRLYRGATEEKKHGMAWTTRLDIAALFARRTTYGDFVGHIWTAIVEPELIFARFSTRGEAEYVIDPTDLEIEKMA